MATGRKWKAEEEVQRAVSSKKESKDLVVFTQGQGGGTRTAGSLDDLGEGGRLMFAKCHRPNPFPQKRRC